LAALAAAELLLARAGGLHPSAKLLPAGVAGIIVLAVLAGFPRRGRWLVIPPAALAAPFRLPLAFGRNTRLSAATPPAGQLGALLPIYLVLAVSALALAWDAVVGRPVVTLRRDIAWPSAAFLAFASLSLLWTEDVGSGRSLLEYFLFPFAVLVAVVGRAPF